MSLGRRRHRSQICLQNRKLKPIRITTYKAKRLPTETNPKKKLLRVIFANPYASRPISTELRISRLPRRLYKGLEVAALFTKAPTFVESRLVESSSVGSGATRSTTTVMTQITRR